MSSFSGAGGTAVAMLSVNQSTLTSPSPRNQRDSNNTTNKTNRAILFYFSLIVYGSPCRLIEDNIRRSQVNFDLGLQLIELEPCASNMTLPKHQDELCFSTDVFLDDKFTVDDFVNQCRKRVTIECLRDDLEAYYRTLKSAMVELINKDYADFVNLSANLVRREIRTVVFGFLYNAHLSLALTRACASTLSYFAHCMITATMHWPQRQHF